MVNIVIGGDVCPINRNEKIFREGDSQSVFNDLLIEFQNADLSIVNLECPFSDEQTPITKEGPVHAVSSECINGFKKAEIDVLCLANNHILDHGDDGLKNTLRVCADAGLAVVGAGMNLNDANKILVKEIKGIRIGIYAVAEHEFSVATEDSPGANPLNIVNYVRTIKSQKKYFDYLIVFVHAGTSGYPLPSPGLREICRFMAEMGANAVICQHSHCPGCYEEYEGSYLIYGQGNLIFDEKQKNNNSWNKGFLVTLQIDDKRNHSMKIVPFVQSDYYPGARRLEKEEERKLELEIKERSSAILLPNYVNEQWLKFCNSNKYNYMNKLLGYNLFFRKVDRRINFLKYFYPQKKLTLIENLIRCEGHREVIETILEKNRKS